ncbi:MAG: hypothetical protein QJR03_00290 [Sphaerobacter sp.]|nr:hypothetical protein [Sphaerobacter sp.]
MTDQALLRIIAASPSKPGDLIVEDRDGQQRLFIGSTGTLSRGVLNGDFLAALLRSDRWEPSQDPTWYSLEDLRRRFAPEALETTRSAAQRIVAALGGRNR